MSISSTNILDSNYSLTQVQDTDPTSPTQTTTSSSDESSDSTTVSKGGQQMAQLQSLASSDPAKFKAVTQKISDELADQAQNESDPQKSKMLTSLSQRFAQAAQSGSMDSLKGAHHHHRHGSGTSASQQYANAGGSGGNSAGGLFSEIGGIISGALSDVDTSTTSTTAAASAGVESTGSTAA